MSGEINRRVDDPEAALARIEAATGIRPSRSTTPTG